MWEAKQKEVAQGGKAGCGLWRVGQLASGVLWEGFVSQEGGGRTHPSEAYISTKACWAGEQRVPENGDDNRVRERITLRHGVCSVRHADGMIDSQSMWLWGTLSFLVTPKPQQSTPIPHCLGTCYIWWERGRRMNYGSVSPAVPSSTPEIPIGKK